MICEFCENNFSSISNLVNHQKTAKYCLKKQNKNIEKQFTCVGCNSEFTRKHDFNRHIKSCKSNLSHEIILENIEIKDKIILMESQFNYKLCEKDKQIEKLENTIKDLQNTIEKLATHAISRPTTSTIKNTQINYIQQMKPVIDDELKDNAQNLTIDHILKGPEGYAQYALEYPLKDRVCCVDYARRKVKFKDPNGNVITDPEMSTLATKFFQSIKDKNKDLIIEYGTKLNEHLGEHLDDLIEILDIKSGVDNGADGSKTEFYHDFVKNICGKTIVE